MNGRALAAVVIAGLVSACGSGPVAQRTGSLQSAWVQLGPDGRPVARAITTAGTCPDIVLDGVRSAMDARAEPATAPPRPTLSGPADSKPSVFDVLSCEKQFVAATVSVVVDGQPLPAVRAALRRIVVVGDTGCRLKLPTFFQRCNDAERWPLQKVAEAAAAAKPDLVIHVGDYHYRENACPLGNAGCAGSPWGYGWDTWDADFFQPAKRLLAAAPWIMVRGNHESCFRGGQGWQRFLDPAPFDARRSCDDPANDVIADFGEPYAVPLSGDMQFIVFDSSNSVTRPLVPGEPLYVRYLAQLEQVDKLAQAKPSNIFLNHHPILGFAPAPPVAGQPEVYPGNEGLQFAMRKLHTDALFPASVQVTIAGHTHLFEAVNFSSGQPAQIVSGNAGSAVDFSLADPLPPGAVPAPGAVVQSIVSTNRFGFLTLDRGDAPGRWHIQAWDLEGEVMAQCGLVGRQISCSPATLPQASVGP